MKANGNVWSLPAGVLRRELGGVPVGVQAGNGIQRRGSEEAFRVLQPESRRKEADLLQVVLDAAIHV